MPSQDQIAQVYLRPPQSSDNCIDLKKKQKKKQKKKTLISKFSRQPARGVENLQVSDRLVNKQQ